MKNKILIFIKNQIYKDKANGVKNPIYNYTHGGCLLFAQMLKKEFPKGEIKYLTEEYHFIFEYAGYLFDVTGNVTQKYKNAKQINFAEYISKNKLQICFSA